MPSKQPLAEFLAAKGFWVIYPRYHGAWESGGEFLERRVPGERPTPLSGRRSMGETSVE